MNYLAHIYLSGNNPKLQIGNFIGDFVKGSQYKCYPNRMQQGVLLHRKVDDFTDNHPVVKESVSLLKSRFGRYSAIILDMYFDYFLAKNFRKYSAVSLHLFAIKFYLNLILHYYFLPKRVKSFVIHFISSHRLYKYASKAGLQNSLEIMAKYKISSIEPDKCIQFLSENEDILETNFYLFFDDLLTYLESEKLNCTL